MKKCLVFLLIYFGIFAVTRGQMSDDFHDGNFSSSPAWYGDLDRFTVNSSTQLQTISNPSAQTVSLTAESALASNVKWTFFIQLGFDPSSQNQAKIYLISDQQDLKAGLNGYFLQIGENGNTDSYDLYKQSGTTVTRLIDGPSKLRSNSSQLIANIEISRTSEGIWELKTATDGSSTWVYEGTATDNTIMVSSWMGVSCRYTTSNSGKFVFDDFAIREMEPGNSPENPYQARRNDIVINEIMADPSPQIQLPGAEFIELWNTTTETIQLQNWKAGDALTSTQLPSVLLEPRGFLILCAKADTSEFRKYGKVAGLSPWPSLNNTGDILTLRNSEGTCIDSVAYSDKWYRSTEKKTGGWTLELISPAATCTGRQNWNASSDSTGGTPGSSNSVFQPDLPVSALKLMSASLADSTTLLLHFNRLIDSTHASVSGNYVLNNGVGCPETVSVEGPEFTTVSLHFSSALARDKLYSVTVSGIPDCMGTLIAAPDNSAQFFYADRIKHGNILISEVLFNPGPGGVDFVEIYNHSDTPLDLQELYLATIKDSLTAIKPVSRNQMLLDPQHYMVLTSDPEAVKNQYTVKDPEAFLTLPSLPAYNDDQGTVVLLGKDSIIIDQFSYTEKMHFALIRDPEGVSLERVNFNRPAEEAGNFRSAASSAGFGTPGYKNSQAAENVDVKEEVSLTSETFSPDNDGFEDALMLNYHFQEAGRVANVTVYNKSGVLVKRLARNVTLAAEGTISWDGLDDSNSCAALGIYVIYMEIFDLKGTRKKFRKSCVLAAKFN